MNIFQIKWKNINSEKYSLLFSLIQLQNEEKEAEEQVKIKCRASKMTTK